MRKIALACAAGLSTSMLVKKMREAALEMGYEAEINAYPVTEAEELKDVDIILLGPQVRYQLNKLKERVSCPVEAIDMAAYGTMDGKKVVAHAKEILGD